MLYRSAKLGNKDVLKTIIFKKKHVIIISLYLIIL